VLFILWRDTTSELWTPVQFPLHSFTVLLLLALFTFLQLLSYYHSIRSILCLQQTGEIDNLIVSWEQSSWLCCVQVSRCCRGKTCRKAVVSGALVRSVTKLASITFWSLAFSYWFDIPWFHNWGKTCYCAHHTFLLGFPTGCYYKPSSSFLALLLGRKKTSARGVSHAQSFTLFLFCFILFLLASFYRKYKKN
jgi:hypothetical protein